MNLESTPVAACALLYSLGMTIYLIYRWSTR